LSTKPIIIDEDGCFGGQEAIIWCMFNILVVFLTIGMTKNLNGQWYETMSCDEAEKVRGFDG
jgi:hypothetical protein